MDKPTENELQLVTNAIKLIALIREQYDALATATSGLSEVLERLRAEASWWANPQLRILSNQAARAATRLAIVSGERADESLNELELSLSGLAGQLGIVDVEGPRHSNGFSDRPNA